MSYRYYYPYESHDLNYPYSSNQSSNNNPNNNTISGTNIGSTNQFNQEYDNRFRSSMSSFSQNYYEPSPYYLHHDNEELSHYLYEERRKNMELNAKVDGCNNDIIALSKKFESKANDYNELTVKFQQSEQIRTEQHKLIEQLQKELDILREKVIKDDNEEVENVFQNNQAVDKNKNENNGKKDTGKPGKKNVESTKNVAKLRAKTPSKTSTKKK